MKLTKADLKLEIARAVAISQKEAKSLLEIILDSMVRSLRQGERVEVRGLEPSLRTLAPAAGSKSPDRSSGGCSCKVGAEFQTEQRVESLGQRPEIGSPPTGKPWI